MFSCKIEFYLYLLIVLNGIEIVVCLIEWITTDRLLIVLNGIEIRRPFGSTQENYSTFNRTKWN